MDAGPRGFERLLRPLRVNLQEHEEKIVVLLALVISALVGLVIVSFVALTEHMGKLLVSAGPVQRFMSPLAGSLIGGWLLFRFFPEARGSGIPQTRVALLLRNGVIGLRTVVGKFVCSSISLGSGVALGREGPSVHIGAGIASYAARRLGLSEDRVRSLVPVGTAAAVAAAFNTPLAAVLFTLEEILADLHARVVGTVVIGAATSWIVLRLILGDEPLFHTPAYQLVHPVEFLFYAVLGVCGGLVSTAFVKLLLGLRIAFRRIPERWRPYSPAVGGLTVGLLALAVPGVLGVGYHLVSDALNGQMALRMMLLLLALKLIATATCYSSGNAGGIFGPSLFIGAMLGGAVGQVAHTLAPDFTGNPGAYALVGMGAAFAGIVRTPMTSVIMIFEVTRDYTIIVPLMIANLCSYLLAQRLQRTPIYEALSKQDGIAMPSAAHRPDPLTVECAMQAGQAPAHAPAVHPDDTLDQALQCMGEARVSELRVVSRDGARQLGVLSESAAHEAYRRVSAQPHDAAPSRNWLPAAAAVVVAAVLLVSGLLFWQRSHRNHQSERAYRAAIAMMEQGKLDDAVSSLRAALAIAPRDGNVRAALGLALVRTGHPGEAESYLNEAARSDPQNGAVLSGLAQIARARGDQARAAGLLQQALAKSWPAEAEPQRRAAQLEYAAALAEEGHTNDAAALLLAVIARRGDDAALGKKAAALVSRFGSPEQIEEAYVQLSRNFPADVSTWMGLGDVRFRNGKDVAALAAFQRAVQADPNNVGAANAVARVEEALRLDPTRRGLSVRERARRWDQLLQRAATAATACGITPELAKAAPLLKKKAVSLELSDQKMDAAVAIWKSAGAPCRTDATLAHIMGKVVE